MGIPARHSTTQYNTTQHNTAQHNNTIQHSTAQHSSAQHNTTQLSKLQCCTAQYSDAGLLVLIECTFANTHLLVNSRCICIKLIQNANQYLDYLRILDLPTNTLPSPPLPSPPLPSLTPSRSPMRSHKAHSAWCTPT